LSSSLRRKRQHTDRDRDPHERSRVGERQRRERDDPADAPEDVEAGRASSQGERREQAPDPLSDHAPHHDDTKEDRGQGQPFRKGMHAAESQELGDAVDGAPTRTGKSSRNSSTPDSNSGDHRRASRLRERGRNPRPIEELANNGFVKNDR
jgi:hypothetical protein